MAKKKQPRGELVSVQPETHVTVVQPTGGVIGKFLDDTHNMFKARTMRMRSLFGRINESGERTEMLLRMGAEHMEAAEAKLQDQLRREGLLPEPDDNNNDSADE